MKKSEAKAKLLRRFEFASKVPDAGASCATCVFLADDKQHCENKVYQTLQQTEELGATAANWCCMAWTGK